MKLSQRLWDTHDDPALFDVTLDMIRKYPDSCNDVWLTTAIGYPSMEAHKKHAEMLVRAARSFRELGVSVSLQVANTLGHGVYMCAHDCEGLVYEGSPVEQFVGSDGTTSPYSYCPRGKHFRAYVNESLLLYADVKPDCLWFDDDFRLLNHKPANEGCFCDNCIAEFNTRYGTSFTREALVEEITHGDKLWRERYLSFQREGLEEMMEESMRLFCEKSPSTVGGLQHAVPQPYIMGDHVPVFDAMKRRGAGAPWSRPGGGTYNDHTPLRFVWKGIDIAFQNARLPDYVTEIYPEIENIPHFAYGKTAAGTAFETSYYFAVGATNMSYSMLKSTAEPVEHYEKFMRLLGEQRPYWEKLAAANRVTRPAGFTYFVSRDAWKMDIPANKGLEALCTARPLGCDEWFRAGYPIHFDDRADNVYLLHPDEAKLMSDKDIAYLLTQRVITCGETLIELRRRGVDIGVDAELLDTFDALPLYVKYTDHPTCNGEKIWESSFFAKGRKESCRLTDKTGRAEVIGVYTSDTVKHDRNAFAPLGISELIVDTKEGGKWAINAYQPWKGLVSRARRDHLLALADYIGKAVMPARMLTANQAILHPRVDADGKTVCVSIANVEIGKSDEAVLAVRAPRGTTFTFSSQYLPDTVLEARREGDEYLVTIPAMDAYTQGTLFCE